MPHLGDDDLASAALKAVLSGERLGTEAIVLVMRVMSRLRAHPAVAQAGDAEDAVLERAHEFFIDKGGALASFLTAQGPRLTPDGLVGVVVTFITNWLDDVWRDTAFGSVQHRLNQVLRKDPAFTRTPDGRWFLTDAAVGTWDGDEEGLLEAAMAVDAPIPAWSSETRRPPLTDGENLVRVLVAILTRADAALPVGVLTRVCLDRFPHADDPVVVAFADDFDRVGDDVPVADRVADVVDAPTEFAEACALVSGMSEDDIFILQHWGDLAAIGEHFGVGRSQASERRRRLKAHLVEQVKDYPDPDDVVRRLPEVFRAWTGSDMSL